MKFVPLNKFGWTKNLSQSSEFNGFCLVSFRIVSFLDREDVGVPIRGWGVYLISNHLQSAHLKSLHCLWCDRFGQLPDNLFFLPLIFLDPAWWLPRVLPYWGIHPVIHSHRISEWLSDRGQPAGPIRLGWIAVRAIYWRTFVRPIPISSRFCFT